MSKVFVDTDVCIDLLSGRKPFQYAAEILFSMADSGKLKIYVSSLSFSNIDYILRSQYNPVNSRMILAKFKTMVHVLAVDNAIIDLAIVSDFSDFEDAIQYFCAIQNGLHVIITRNLRDYKKSAIKVITPETYLAL